MTYELNITLNMKIINPYKKLMNFWINLVIKNYENNIKCICSSLSFIKYYRNQTLDILLFILFIIISNAGIVLPLLKKFYPYEDGDNESLNSKPINTSNDYATKLRELKSLHEEGILDDKEYRLAKENIISKL